MLSPLWYDLVLEFLAIETQIDAVALVGGMKANEWVAWSGTTKADSLISSAQELNILAPSVKT